MKKRTNRLIKAEIPALKSIFEAPNEEIFFVSISTLIKDVFGWDGQGLNQTNLLICYLVIKGYSNTEISNELELSPGSVTGNIKKICEVLDTSERYDIQARTLYFFLNQKKIGILPINKKLSKNLTLEQTDKILKSEIQ